MKSNRMLLATAGTTLVLVSLIGWVFYHSLQFNSENASAGNDYPAKSVMAQARELNEAYLTRLSRQGKVVKGMRAEHVRTALGAAQRVEENATGEGRQTTWWYKKDGWMGVVFENNKVVKIIRP